MKIKSNLFQVIVFFVFNLLAITNYAQVTITIENIKKSEGTMRVGLYTNAEAYDEEGEIAYGKIVKVSKAGQLTFEMDDVPFGEYSIAVFHDVNSNEILDTNFMGIPKEPYGFSNNPKAKFRKPKFEETLISYSEQNQQFEINLISW